MELELTASTIRKELERIKKEGNSREDIDKLLNRILEDYDAYEKSSGIIDGQMHAHYSCGRNIRIEEGFNGEVMPDTVLFEGTTSQWERMSKPSYLEEIPRINCLDGSVVQKL